ncbi:MAG: hypothetical protein HYX75_15800 [Acidobacteria bacterium]|nr:hypothetical protein [Acidobacteriota bacterium]
MTAIRLPPVRYWPIIFITATFLLFFFRVCFFGEVFFFRDHYQEYYPLKHMAVQMVRAGVIPAWNPSSMTGQPFLANPNWTLLYPPNVLLFFGDFSRTYSLLFATHFLLASLGLYYLCRVLGRSAAAAVTGATIYAFGGYFLSQGSFMPTLFTMTWQPWVLAEFLRNLRESAPRRRWALVGSVSLMVLAGEPVTILATAAIALLLTTGQWRLLAPDRLHLRALVRDPRWLALGLLVIAIYPRAVFLAESGRVSGLSLDMATSWPLVPRLMPETLIANMFGSVHEYFPWRALGAYLTDARFPYLLSIYIGAPCLLLAARRISARPRPWIGLLVTLCAIVLALGAVTPLFRWFWTYVPLASMLRYPIKFVFFPVFLSALWAAEGYDRLNESRRLGRSIPIVAAAIALLLFGSWMAYSPENLSGLLTSLGSSGDPASVSHAIRIRVVMSVGVLIGTTASLFLLSRGRQTPFFAILIADLFAANFSLNPTVSTDFHAPQSLASTLASPRDRLMVLAPFAGKPGLQPSQYRSYSEYLSAGGRAQLYALSAADSGVRYAFDPSIDRSFSPATQAVVDALRGRSFADAKPILDMAAVRWFLSPEPLISTGIALHQVISLPGEARAYLYENLTSLSRVFLFLGDAASLPASAHVTRLSSAFDPRRELLIDGTPMFQHGTSTEMSDEIEILVDSPVQLTVRTKAKRPAYLVCSDTFDRNWRAEVDGKPARVFLADGAFRAVEVSAGGHVVELSYPLLPHYAAAAAVLLLCVIVIAGFVVPTRSPLTA